MSAKLLPRHFVEKPWGRTDLPPTFDVGGTRIGEVWFDLANESLPVLVKWLFTSEKLSIQVHPNDSQALERGLLSGKEECWIVTHSEPGATLGIGTIEPLTSAELREASLTGEIEELMDWKPVQPGDWFYIPAGTVHAIGAGVTLVEVQQNADVTYRLYDYGRPRELHLAEGIAVSNAVPYEGPSGRLGSGENGMPFVRGPNFSITHHIDKSRQISVDSGQRLLVPLNGQVASEACTAKPGDVMLIQSDSPEVIEIDGECLMIHFVCPDALSG